MNGSWGRRLQPPGSHHQRVQQRYTRAALVEPLTPIHTVSTIDDVSLAKGRVDLWRFAYEDVLGDELTAAYLALLTDAERARHERYYFDKDKRMFLATRALVRTVLSRYRPAIAPAAWRFSNNEYGRPFVDNDRGLYFNLSNTRGLVVCAVANHEAVGVDVENTTRRTEPTAIAHRFFSASEVAALQALPTAQQRERFFSLWTLKESYIKARSMGLAIPLGRFSFELRQADHITIGFDALDDDPSRWHFALMKAADHHRVAVSFGAREPMTLRTAMCVPLRS